MYHTEPRFFEILRHLTFLLLPTKQSVLHYHSVIGTDGNIFWSDKTSAHSANGVRFFCFVAYPNATSQSILFNASFLDSRIITTVIAIVLPTAFLVRISAATAVRVDLRCT